MGEGAIRRTSWLATNEAIRTRRAVRGFLPDAVPRETVEELLTLASRAPSGSNIQPWRVRVVSGEAKRALTEAICTALDTSGERPKLEWEYYPVKWREPYIGRRRKIGLSLYGLLGIGKGDTEAAERYRRRNFEFFGAPVGMIFTLEQDLEIGSWLDLGIFLGTLTVAARGRGLDTCLQQSFAEMHATLHAHLGIPDNERVICGMALGYADEDAVQNKLITERVPVADFAVFSGFPERDRGAP